MGRRTLLWRPKALTHRPYEVLAKVSLGYPPPKGRYPTCYSPVRRSSPEVLPLDLHVLSPPLAFALSQDQTLQFNLFVTASPAPVDRSTFLSVPLSNLRRAIRVSET